MYRSFLQQTRIKIGEFTYRVNGDYVFRYTDDTDAVLIDQFYNDLKNKISIDVSAYKMIMYKDRLGVGKTVQKISEHYVNLTPEIPIDTYSKRGSSFHNSSEKISYDVSRFSTEVNGTRLMARAYTNWYMFYSSAAIDTKGQRYKESCFLWWCSHSWEDDDGVFQKVTLKGSFGYGVGYNDSYSYVPIAVDISGNGNANKFIGEYYGASFPFGKGAPKMVIHSCDTHHSGTYPNGQTVSVDLHI